MVFGFCVFLFFLCLFFFLCTNSFWGYIFLFLLSFCSLWLSCKLRFCWGEAPICFDFSCYWCFSLLCYCWLLWGFIPFSLLWVFNLFDCPYFDWLVLFWLFFNCWPTTCMLPWFALDCGLTLWGLAPTLISSSISSSPTNEL